MMGQRQENTDAPMPATKEIVKEEELQNSSAAPPSLSSHQRQRIWKFVDLAPKVELHAHLNGSIREETLLDLARERGVTLSSKLHGILPPNENKDDDEKNRRCDSQNAKELGFNENCRRLRHSRASFFNSKPRSLLDCFEIFAEIPKCVDDLDALRRITREAMEDFASENVAYLELRSTPKRLFSYDVSTTKIDELENVHCSGQKRILETKRKYVETILDEMKDFEDKERERYAQEKKKYVVGSSIVRLPLLPRYILSVDRSGTVEEALDTIHLAIEMFRTNNEYIVGVEMGGNPTKNDFHNFEPAFRLAREAGMRVAIHCGEVPCGSSTNEQDASLKKAFDEAMRVIEFRPDRLGHGLLLPESITSILQNDPIPIECCPTSNVMTLELAQHHEGSLIEGLRGHPQLSKWLKNQYPISINTDDSGVFNTTLTRELLLLVEAYGVDEFTIRKIILNSIDHCFEQSDDVRFVLRENVSMQFECIAMCLDH
uniref:Adenosine deaminase domain-containing protein n=2 Tax=Ditylum brightwellii TaxID=49249 RepID=A0A7S4WC74_9STRA